MPHSAHQFDIEAVRKAWNTAADAYAEGQASGRDYYRYEFFGPEQVALCGNVAGLQLLDLGCGCGYFAREMAVGGAIVTGIDVSDRMVEHARRVELEAPLGITYVVSDAARLDGVVGAASFDMVTSCLALQDMPDIPRVLRSVRRALKPGGRFVASITHPFSDTPYREWERDSAGRKRWLCVDRYFEKGPLEFNWNGWSYEFTTPAMHATLQDWFGWFVESGLVMSTLLEPRPTASMLERRPDLEDAARVPYYLLLEFTSPHRSGIATDE